MGERRGACAAAVAAGRGGAGLAVVVAGLVAVAGQQGRAHPASPCEAVPRVSSLVSSL